jgi:hypothetical protein
MSGGALTTVDAFSEVFGFIAGNFASWAFAPLHCQFTDNEFGPSGEIRHVPYGDGTLRVGPLVMAAARANLDMTLISEAREDSSHDAIQAEVVGALADPVAEPPAGGRPIGSGIVTYPEERRIVADGDGWSGGNSMRPLRLTNIDKPFFPDGYTKGDLIGYYAAVPRPACHTCVTGRSCSPGFPTAPTATGSTKAGTLT